MRSIHAILPAAMLIGMGGLIVAQPALAQGTKNPAAVTGGTYKADPNHSQILFTYSHLGFTQNMGIASGATGTLMLDPKAPNGAKVSIDVPIASIHTTIAPLDAEFQSAGWFNAAQFPTAHFESTSVAVSGSNAKIMGNLTIKGITKPITIDASLEGAGTNPMSKKESIGFSGKATIKRSDFGLGQAVPMVGDNVMLTITVGFDKQ